MNRSTGKELVRELIEKRNSAVLNGECPECGNAVSFQRAADGMDHPFYSHEDSCSLGDLDERIKELSLKFGFRFDGTSVPLNDGKGVYLSLQLSE